MTERRFFLEVQDQARRDGVVLGDFLGQTSTWNDVDALFYLHYDYGRLRGITLISPDLVYPFVSMQDRKRRLEELAARYPHLGLVWTDDNEKTM